MPISRRSAAPDFPHLDAQAHALLTSLASTGRIYDIPTRRSEALLHSSASMIAMGLLALLGVVCLVLVLVDGRVAAIAALFLVLPYWAVVRWRRYALRLRSPGALEVLLSGHGPFFLYLRPFNVDRIAPTPEELMDGLLTSHRRDGIEEDVARLLRPTGPLVALGRPGESVPLLGALRFYVAINPSDRRAETQVWQACVTQLARQARLVILRPGQSPGVHWEYLLCAAQVPCNRVVVRIAPGDWDGYYALCEFLRHRAAAELPRHPGEYVTFDPDGRPVTGDSLGRLLARATAQEDCAPLVGLALPPAHDH